MTIAALTASHRVPGPTFADVRAELLRTAAERAAVDPLAVRKGNMTEGQAAERQQILQAMAADIDRICARAGTGTEQHRFPWAARRRELQAELDRRRRDYPPKVRAGDFDQATADRRILQLRAALAIYEDGWDWPPNPQDPRRWIDQFRDVAAAIDAEAPEAQRALGL